MTANMKWIIMICTYFAALSPLSAYEIREVHSLGEITPQLEAAGQESLVLFDIDNVLLIPDHPAFQIANWGPYKPLLRDHYDTLSAEEREALVMLMIIENEPLLIDALAPELIARLIDRGVPTLALTAAWSKGHLADHRVNALRRFEIEMKGQGGWPERIVFDQFCQANGSYPLYQDGVLFTNGKAASKGELLRAFFTHTSFRPERILFIDDHRNNLESVGETMDELGIPSDLIWYHGAKHFESGPIDKEEMESVWSEYVKRAKEIAA